MSKSFDTKSIEAFARGLFDAAKLDLEQDGGINPIIGVLTPKGESILVAGVSEIPKRVMMAAVHKIAQQHKAVAVVMIHDGWYLSGEAAKEFERRPEKHSGPISKHPDRKEALTGIVILPTGQAMPIHLFAPYTRDQAHKKITWETLPEELAKPQGEPHTEQNMILPWLDIHSGATN